MSKSLLGLTALILAGAAGSAMAADGTIEFKGQIIAASCIMKDGGNGGTVSNAGKTITVNLGAVSKDSLTGSAEGANIVAAKNINLVLDCANAVEGLNNVHVTFLPKVGTGTGLDASNNKLLKTSGTAEGVGIGLFDASNQLINLADPMAKLSGTLTINADDPQNIKGSANLNLRAAYVANGVAIKAGTANGTLPFVLNYD
ncbi:fimbrial protein [Pseudoxanthomonas beigongshangi]